MKYDVIEGSTKCPIEPIHINTKQHFFDALGNTETETSAYYIVLLCQKVGGWDPFTLEQIETLYNQKGYKYFHFNHLLDDGWIVRREDKYYITLQFVTRVYGSSPVK